MIDIQEIIDFTNARHSNKKNLKITGFNALADATYSELTFFIEDVPSLALERTKAEVILVNQNFQPQDSNKVFLFVAHPKLTFFRAQEKFSFKKVYSKKIHPQAIVAASAQIGKNVTIYPFVHIDNGAIVEEGSVIYSHCYIGEEASIGAHCIIYSNCSILDKVILGDSVIIHSGCVVGSDGFGFVTEKQIHHKVPHCGTVEIADKVEIGANCSIDRATFGSTKIGQGTKIDNLVHIGHNVQIGENCLIAGQVGIAGSTKLGNSVYCGGQVGILGHNNIEDGCVFHPRCCFMQEHKTLPSGSHMAGVPAIPLRQWRKNIVVQKKLVSLEKKVRSLSSTILPKES